MNTTCCLKIIYLRNRKLIKIWFNENCLVIFSMQLLGNYILSAMLINFLSVYSYFSIFGTWPINLIEGCPPLFGCKKCRFSLGNFIVDGTCSFFLSLYHPFLSKIDEYKKNLSLIHPRYSLFLLTFARKFLLQLTSRTRFFN